MFQSVSIVDIFTVCFSGLALYLAWKKSGSEMKKNRSESTEASGQAAESFASAAQMYSQENVKLHSQVESLETQMCQLRVDFDTQKQEYQNKINDLTCRLDGQAQEITDLKDWATRLSAQVVSMGGEPVPYKLIKKGKP